MFEFFGKIGIVNAQEFDPIVLLGWIVALGLLLWSVLAVNRWRKQERERERRRIEDLIDEVMSHNFSGARWSAPPELPALEIIPSGTLPKRCIVAEDGDLTLAVIDHSLPKMRPEGMNIEITGSDDSRRVRSFHTFVCLHSPRLLIPEFTILPRPMEKAVSMLDSPPDEARLRTAKSRKLVEALMSATFAPYDLPHRMHLEALDSNDYALFGKDSSGISVALTGNVLRLVENCQGLIVAGSDTWVMLSLNVKMADAEISPRGILPVDEVSKLIALARQFVARFEEPTSS